MMTFIVVSRFASMYLYASRYCANGKIFEISGFSCTLPASTSSIAPT